MNIEQIKQLAEIVNDYGLTKLKVKEGEIEIGREIEVSPIANNAVGAVTGALPNEVTGKPVVADSTPNYSNLETIKSPMVGVFYSASSPDSPPFISIGSKVKKGDVVCIVEAMKSMNEIIAEQDGEVVDICVSNNDIVEFGQVLFKLS